jgi:hypothetical protein
MLGARPPAIKLRRPPPCPRDLMWQGHRWTGRHRKRPPSLPSAILGRGIALGRGTELRKNEGQKMD